MQAFHRWLRGCLYYIKARRIITCGLSDKNVALIMKCSCTAHVFWHLFVTINENSENSDKLFLRQIFSRLRIDASHITLERICKVEMVTGQLEAANSRVKNDDVVMTLQNSLPENYSNPFTDLNTMDGELSLTDLNAITARRG